MIKPNAIRSFCRLLLATLLVGGAAFLTSPLVAQQVPDTSADNPSDSVSDDATHRLTVADVEAELAVIESDSSMADATKDLLRTKYRRAIEALKQAAEHQTKSEEYRQAIESAPDQADDQRAQLKALPKVENAADVTESGSTEDLQKAISSQQASLNALNDDLAAMTKELNRMRVRPAEISGRLPEAQGELSDVRTQLTSPKHPEDASLSNVADRIFLQAVEARLLAELELLKAEQLSHSAREDLLGAKHELLTRQGQNDEAALTSLESFVHQRLVKEAEDVGSMADTTPEEVPESARELAIEVPALAAQLMEVVETSKRVSGAHDRVATQFRSLTAEYEIIRDQVDLGGTGEAMARLLFNLQNRVHAMEVYAANLMKGVPTLQKTRLAQLKIEKGIDSQPDRERQFSDESSVVVARLVAGRAEALETLRTQYQVLIPALTALEANHRQLLDKADEVSRYTAEKLFWIRGFPSVSIATISEIPVGFRWIFQSAHGEEFVGAIQEMVGRSPFRSAGIALVLVGLVLMRRRMIGSLERTGVEIRRISTDRYGLTVAALLWTILLAAPFPLALAFLHRTLGQVFDPSDWLRGVTYGLRWAARITFIVGFIAELCRPGGLAVAHFGWKEEPLIRVRSAMFWFSVVYIPALLMTAGTCYGDASEFAGGLGRISFVLSHIWVAFVIWRSLRLSDLLRAWRDR
jgi:small-conductance mechanosensitive channel